MIKISNISKSNNLYNVNEKVGANNTSQESHSNASGINQLKKESKDTFTKSSELSEKEKQVVEELKRRDQEVRQHEQAHIAAGGSLVRGGANFNYQVGPDGKQYAIGGEVQIDVSPEDTPEATIRKMQQVQRAALAPGDPSPQDRAVAAMASRMEAQAASEQRSNNSHSSVINSKSNNSETKSSSSNISPQAKLALSKYQKSNTIY
ncbi:MAG: putative metalloprotease CJM1_0395 family protein [Bacteroidota bacterium]